METIQYKLERFEGPLELLLSLVTRHKMNIEDIPIDLLCEQYMAYISEAAHQSIDLACEFLSMASELMLIKSRMLLPRTPENAEDPRTPLVNALVEYQKAKLAATQLAALFAEYGSRMVKEQDDVSADRTYVAPHHVELLRAALTHVLTETKAEKDGGAVRKEFEDIVNAPQIPLKIIIGGLIDRLSSPAPLYLDDYFTGTDDKSTLIAKFIGILELLKSQKIRLDETKKNEDGVTDTTYHVSITLAASLEELRASSLEWEET
ncbi:MAG: segregation and condensation protein A [Eubacteriales bacterium]